MDSATDRRHSSPGFPHSGIPGSRPACGFPRLIAACYALHRLLMPRHPPYTLSNLTSLTSDTHDLGSVYSVVKEPPARGRNLSYRVYSTLVISALSEDGISCNNTIEMLPSATGSLYDVFSPITADTCSGESVHMPPLRGSTIRYPIRPPNRRFPPIYQPLGVDLIGIDCSSYSSLVIFTIKSFPPQ